MRVFYSAVFHWIKGYATLKASWRRGLSGKQRQRRRVDVRGELSEQGRRHLGIAAARTICRLSAPLSIDTLRRLGALAGDLAWQRNSRAARTTRTNIDVVYGKQSRRWRQLLARESIRHTSMTAFELAALWTWPLPRLAELVVDVEGASLLRDRPRGRGVLALVPHFGNWEFLGYYLNTIEPLTPLYEPPASPTVDAALLAARSRLGSRPAANTISGLRRLLETLRDGGMVAVLPDQVPRRGVTVPFFGQPAVTVVLVSKLLQSVQADVVMACARRTAGGFAIHIDRVDAATHDPDPSRSATAMNAGIEATVRLDPAQYQWEYKRFRFPGQPNMYA